MNRGRFVTILLVFFHIAGSVFAGYAIYHFTAGAMQVAESVERMANQLSHRRGMG